MNCLVYCNCHRQRTSLTNKMKGLVLCVLVALIALQLIPEGDAFCCGSIFGGTCHDCTLGTPCCATRPCNIFCCACKGECRSGGCRGRRSPDDVTPRDNATSTGHDVISAGDLNGDGQFHFDEAITYLTDKKGYDRDTAEMKLIELDVDKNKIFTVDEIDG